MLRHNFDEVIERKGTDCKKWNTYPDDVLPMWIADTDFRCPQPIIDAVIKRAEHGIYGYPFNDNNFNRAVKCWQQKRFGWEIDEDWVEYTPGVVPAIIYAIRAFTDPGDKVLIQTPVYPPFHASIVNNGRIKVENSLILKDGRYSIDMEDLEEKLQDPRTRLMLICSPQNPTGRVFTREELMKIGELCLKHHVIVVSDEIHSDLVYSGHKHLPFGSLSPEIGDNCLVLVNPSKTFNIAGVRTSAVITPNKVLRDTFKESVVNNKAYGRTVFGTLLLETAYNQCDYYADQLIEYLESNLDFLLKYFAERIPKIKVIKPEATFLVWLDCRELGMSQDDLNSFMLTRAKVALNDGATFGQEGKGFLRINIGCPRTVLEKGLKRIEAAVNSI